MYHRGQAAKQLRIRNAELMVAARPPDRTNKSQHITGTGQVVCPFCFVLILRHGHTVGFPMHLFSISRFLPRFFKKRAYPVPRTPRSPSPSLCARAPVLIPHSAFRIPHSEFRIDFLPLGLTSSAGLPTLMIAVFLQRVID